MQSKRGFTLIEVMMSLAILTTVVLGMATTTSHFVHTVTVGDRKASARQLVDSRVETIQMDPDYINLESNYVGTETSFPTLDGYTRTTEIVQVGGSGQTQDYKKITVTVDGPGLTTPLQRSVTVGAP